MSAAGPVRRWAALAGLALLPLAACTSSPADDGGAGHHAGAPTQAVGRAVPCPVATGNATGQPRLPELTLPCLGGGDAVPLRGLTGTPTVLNLWASWCAPCRTELPAFQQLSAAAGGALRVFGVDSEDREGSARTFATVAGIRFASAFDEDGKLHRALGKAALPVTVLVAADGRVAQVYSGAPLTYDSLRRLVRDALGVTVS
jgi:thiol-disulfide isomerase/thioredoxin